MLQHQRITRISVPCQARLPRLRALHSKHAGFRVSHGAQPPERSHTRQTCRPNTPSRPMDHTPPLLPPLIYPKDHNPTRTKSQLSFTIPRQSSGSNYSFPKLRRIAYKSPIRSVIAHCLGPHLDSTSPAYPLFSLTKSNQTAQYWPNKFHHANRTIMWLIGGNFIKKSKTIARVLRTSICRR